MNPARWPLAVQMALAFIVIVALALGGGGALLLYQLTNRQLAERSQALLAQGAAVSQFITESSTNGPPVTETLRRFHAQTGVRLLLTDTEGVVTADSAPTGSLIGQRLTHPEVQAALQGAAKAGDRWLGAQGGWLLYGAVPVNQGSAIRGALLLSADLSPLDRTLAEVRRSLLLGALVAGTIAALLGAALARFMVRPLERLGRAVAAFASGRLEARVTPGGSREVAVLGSNFNTMATALLRLDQQRKSFVADASHELRTPVSAIRALAEGLLQTGEIPERYTEYLEDIAGECTRAGRLVDRLLELARLDLRQERRTEPSPIDLVEVVSDLVVGLRPLARERGVALQWAPTDAVSIAADPRLLEAALGNLIENGLKYTPSGGEVLISITVDESRIRCTVVDNGPGIPPLHLPHIFERFYRVDKARARRTGGAGLGLAIAAEAASGMGGQITVASTVGEGSSFTLELPK